MGRKKHEEFRREKSDRRVGRGWSYTAVDLKTGNVYGGITDQTLAARNYQHSRNGKKIVDAHQVDLSQLSETERRNIQFLRSQAREEPFDCDNVKGY